MRLQCATQETVTTREVWLEADHGSAGLDRAFGIVLEPQTHEGELVVRSDEVGLELDRSLELLDGSVGIPHFAEHEAEQAIWIRPLRLELNCLTEGWDRAIGVAQDPSRIPEVVVCDGQCRFETDRLKELEDSAPRVARVREDVADVVVRLVHPETDRLSVRLDRAVVVVP